MATPSSQFAREKLIHAIIFFTTRTSHCQKTKLYKLLSFLDFEIYSQTGRTVTGLDYFAWPMGPVPKALHEELNRPPKDLKENLSIRNASMDLDGPGGLLIKARTPFDPSWFTDREIGEMERLAEIFKDATAATMVAAAHGRGAPWYRVWSQEKRQQALIPYAYALDSPGAISKQLAEFIEEQEREDQALFG